MDGRVLQLLFPGIFLSFVSFAVSAVTMSYRSENATL